MNASDLQHRYEGKPMLKVLECYVLWTIDALPPQQDVLLQKMAPRLREIWNRTEGLWHDIVAAQMQFPPTMPATIRDMWRKNQIIAADNKVALTPLDFTYMFVDQNFNH